MSLPKYIPTALIIHHCPQYPSYARRIRCGKEPMSEPRNYSVSWKDVNCLDCKAWLAAEQRRKLLDRIARLEARIKRDQDMLAFLQGQL